MLALRLTVVTADGSNTYGVSPKVQVEFERHFKVGIAKAFQDEQKVEHIYWLAWKAAHAGGAVVKPFDGWLDDILDVQLEDGNSAPFDATA
jgi:hypothetical protein